MSSRRLRTLLIVSALVGVALLIFAIAATEDSEPVTPPTTTTVITLPPTTTTTTLPEAELIEGVSVVFQARSNILRNSNVRAGIQHTMRVLPDHLADEIREIIIYVVDRPTRCVGASLPPGWVVAGCADPIDNAWIELIVSQGGHRQSTIVHEFGHIIGGHVQPWGTQRYATYFNQVWIVANEDTPPTQYSQRFFHEDYAESFELYVLDANRLKRCCPARFAYFEELFQEPRAS